LKGGAWWAAVLELEILMRVPALLRFGLVTLLLWTLGARSAWADRPASMSPRTIALPSGPASMKGLGESFAPNLSTGVGNFGVPIELPPGLASPSLAIRYTNGRGRSDLGAGFHIPVLHVYRTKDKGSPLFNESDRFAVSSGDLNDELVLVNADRQYYRLKNEGGFALFVRDAREDTWTVRMPNGDVARLGTDESSRQYSSRGVYQWFVRSYEDAHHHGISYEYETDLGYVYLRAVRYQLHAAGYENAVELTRELRQDSFTDYSYGSAVTCRKRVTSIDVYAGCGLGCSRRKLRTYALGYDATTSLLTSIQMMGEGGTTFTPTGDSMPPLRFSYVPQSRGLGQTVTMPQALPLELVASGRAQFDDVNGDGLPDLLVGEARNYSYYENRTGTTWSAANTLARSPDVALDDDTNGVVLTDVDGDGFRDVLRASTQAYTYYPGGNINGARFVSYMPPVALAAAPGQALWSDRAYRLADLNADGRTDLLAMRGAQSVPLLNLAAFGREGVQELPAVSVPQDVARLFNDPSLQMVDFNGDGTQDFVATEISWGPDSRLRVFYGLGAGAYANPKSIAAPKGNPADYALVDLNNDGYIDILKYSGQQIVYWLGSGDDRFAGPFGPNNAWSAPPRSDLRSVQFMDMDGSGTVDLVLLTKANKVVYVTLFSNPNVGLLSRVDNGMGMVTDITYRSSTDYAVDAKLRGTPWRTTLPKPMPVISEIRVTDSLDKLGLAPQVHVTTLEYADGYFDGREREFRGFGYVKMTEHGDAHAETKVTETWMSIGKDPATGADQEALKGKALRAIVSDGNGNVYSSVETTWEARWMCAEDGPGLNEVLPTCANHPRKVDHKDLLVALAVPTASLRAAWEKTTTPKYTLEEMQHDIWGNVTRLIEYGHVTFNAPRAIGDPFRVADVDPFAGDDERVKTTEYIYDIGAWRIGAAKRTESRDFRTDAVLSAAERYYDGAPYVGLPLGEIGAGDLTRHRTWLAEENRWIDDARAEFDAHGHVVGSLDPKGNRGTVEYDPATSTFPITETVHLTTGAIVFRALYDNAFGTVLSATDPNGRATRYKYDGLGRLRAVIDIESSDERPTMTYDYEFGTSDSPVSTVVERRLADRATGTYRNVWHYSDGLGRERLKKIPGATPGTYIATGWAELSPIGEQAYDYEEYASTQLGLEPPPTGTPVIESTYDALGRMIMVYPPATGGPRTYSKTEYLPSETRVFDEEDTSEQTWLYPAITRTDGLGRVREIVKYNDYRASAGASAERAELKWVFQYNESGSVTSWTDPKQNVRTYAYDSLNRLVDLFDPNLGPIHYAYDDASNLIQRVDALGQERHYDYGAANRLDRVSIKKDARGAPDYEYVYHYDKAAPGGPVPQAANLAGRLAWVEWPTGSTHYSFDTLGRTASQTQTLWNPETSTFEAQTRDVFTKQFDYNAAGDVVQTRLPGGRAFTASYDARGLLASIASLKGAETKPLVRAIQYDLEGNVRRTENANGTVGCAWYNARTELVAIAAGPQSSVSCDASPTRSQPGTFQHLTYTRTTARAIGSIADLSVDGNLPRLDAEYTYDRLHELTWSRSAKGTDAYEYDAIQNLIRHTSNVPNAPAVLGDLRYAENGGAPNRLTSAGGTTFAYDGVGNLAAYNGYTLEFNAENKLVAARKAGASTVRFYYDFMGERRITTVERAGQAAKVVVRDVFEDYQLRGSEETWTVGAGHTGVEITRSGATESVRYAHKDQLTGTTHLTDESGTLVGFQQYGPYGDVIARIGAKPLLHGFAGARAEPDEDLGLVRFGARYYAPALARWISPDTFVGESAEKILKIPLEANLYGYASNNPINLIDPRGTDSWYESAWNWGSDFTVGVAEGAYGAAKETVKGAYQVVRHPVDTAVAVYDAGRQVVNDPVGSAERAWDGAKTAAVEVVDTIASGDPKRIGRLTGKVAFEVAATWAGAKAVSAGSGLARQGLAKVATAVERRLPKAAVKLAEGAKRVEKVVCHGGCGKPGGACFVAGTPVHVGEGRAPIETIRVGQRVRTAESSRAEDSVIDDAWRVLQLEMPNPDGSEDFLEIELLRPLDWLDTNGAAIGAWLDVALDDIGLRGPAVVVGIFAPPVIAPGPGRIVTGTVSHANGYVVRLRLSGEGDGILTTGPHRFYSVDRADWVRASELRVGEQLWTRGGVRALLGKEDVPGIHRVYNLEVDGDHEYLVGEQGIRVHNNYTGRVGKWVAGTFADAAKSLEYHFGKHGLEVGAKTIEQYLAKAEAFAQNLRGARSYIVEGATEGVKRYVKNGKYIDLAPGGQIVSFGKI
jgi:RHS repeat-associated protein